VIKEARSKRDNPNMNVGKIFEINKNVSPDKWTIN